MKIICMDCQTESHVDVEMLKGKKKLTCTQCDEKPQSQPTGQSEARSAPPSFDELPQANAATERAIEIFVPMVDEADVLEIPEIEPALETVERWQGDEAMTPILFEPEASPAVADLEDSHLDSLREDSHFDSPRPATVHSVAAYEAVTPAVFNLREDQPARQENLPEQLPPVEISNPAEAPLPKQVRLLKFSTASLAVGLGAFVLFIFLGETFIKPTSSAIAVTPARAEVKALAERAHNQEVATVIQPAPPVTAAPVTAAPEITSTPAPTPEPTPVAETKQAETKQEETKQVEAAQPVVAAGVKGEGRFAVQVGSYNELNQANERANKLKAAGFDPRVVSVELPKRGTWFRVMVGSFSDRAEANRFGTQMRSQGAAENFVIADL